MVPIVMTIAFVAARDHAIPCYRECYGNTAPRVHGVFPLDHVAFIVSGDVFGSQPRLIATLPRLPSEISYRKRFVLPSASSFINI